ncbi:MAG TPA: hypothetical protein VK424_08685 [Thermoplasmata archaeon]|nr:hypothetical protein [Thermoplasmata archaeon]
MGTASNPGTVERLRRAREAGVTTFDVAGSTHPAHARWLLAEAFPEPDPQLVVILNATADMEEPLAPSSAPLPTTLSRTVPAEPRRSPAPFPANSTIVEVEADQARSTRRDSDSIRTARTEGPTARRALRLAPDSERLPDAPGISLYSGPLSLLEFRLGQLVEGARRPAPLGFLARDPFSGGRLDGTRFSGNWLERGPAATPASLRSLAADFEPVLRLGFLTAERTRTLAQAALQYAGYRPWVMSVLAPLPSSDRLGELLSAFARPALTATEVARIEQGGPSPTAPPRATDLRRSNSTAE